QVDRFPARLEERHDSVRAALPGTIQHWSLNLNPPHTRNSGYLLDSVEQLQAGIQHYIHYYNHERIRLKLKGLSPVQYRTQPRLA
ncbi:IS3 family transposase, partial [Burkholderia dolosa]|uniref:IS3 family transposase n=1 Tax=Burkholderia dolosa TaxID=152500 RepID=UPI002010D167